MSYGNREMHKATCADCGKECDVPFKPDGSRPVLLPRVSTQKEDHHEDTKLKLLHL
jgi:CxxC-x17-CxxC domain-containing protein